MDYSDKTDDELQFDLAEADKAIGQMQRSRFQYPESTEYATLHASLVNRRNAIEDEINRRAKVTPLQ